jgi:hypothetical protein
MKVKASLGTVVSIMPSAAAPRAVAPLVPLLLLIEGCDEAAPSVLAEIFLFSGGMEYELFTVDSPRICCSKSGLTACDVCQVMCVLVFVCVSLCTGAAVVLPKKKYVYTRTVRYAKNGGFT